MRVVRGSYHHGNLPLALIEAAIVLIETRGAMGFTLSEAARRAGVSPAAPYRHFAGRDDLLAEVARQGFIEFAERLSHVYEGVTDKSTATLMEILLRFGSVYLGFARERKGLYMAMFESGLDFNDHPQTGPAARQAYGVLFCVSRDICAQLPPDHPAEPAAVANFIWAFAHGVVALFGRAQADRFNTGPLENVLREGVFAYLRGLGLVIDRPS